MKTNIFRQIALLSLFVLFTLALTAQPPAQGPPPPGDPYQSIGVGIITSLLKGAIQQTVDSTNARIERQSESTGVKARLSFTYKIFKPGMSVTTFQDRPNQNIVRIAYSVDFDVTNIRYHGIPYFSRKINQSIEVNVACKNWFTDNGVINIATKVDKPFLDNASFAEQALNFFIGNTLLNLVDSKMRQTLPDAFKTSTNWPNSTCNCLSVDSGSAPHYEFGEVKFALKKGFKPPIGTAFDQATVTLKSIKRLAARDNTGNALYTPMEDIQILFYANQTLRVANLTQMKEGEERPLNVQSIIFPRPAPNGLIVLIGNVEQQNSNNITDSRFAAFNKTVNYGHGVQKLIVQKSYWLKPQRLPNGQMTKPLEVKVNAYEFTVQINAPVPVVINSKGDKAKVKN